MSQSWKTGLCSCFNDCSTCIISYCFPCYIFGLNASAVGDHCCLCACVYCNIWARIYIRGKIRGRRDISGSCCCDFCATLCCFICTLYQEAVEAKEIVAAPQEMAIIPRE